MKKKLLTITAASMLIAGCGGTKTIIREVAATTTAAPYVAPVTNKYDDYYAHVLDNSGQANSESKADVIEFGDLVCQSLDEGQTVAAVARVITNASSSTSGLELGAAVIYGAITYLCPEYAGDLRAYLTS